MKNIDNIYILICLLSSAIIILFKAHNMSRFHTRNFRLESIFVTTFLQRVRIKPHLSSLRSVENSRNNFRQSVQICCREKEKEENDGNCKAFCVTRKHNNTIA